LKDPAGQLVASIPDGYEVYENINAQVFLRRKTAQVILPEELALVEKALLDHGGPWRYRAEIKKDIITVYQADDQDSFDGLAKQWGRRPLSRQDMGMRASYMAVLRFTLVDKKPRVFGTERFCFRGSIDDWIPLGKIGTLASLTGQFVRHLGQDSFFELF
jgi:hypothetical protein